MFKLYKKADILEKISDKVKTVDDLFNLPLSEFDRECCDYWFNDYLEKLETENNLCASRDIRLVAILKQQLEGLLSCEDVQIVER